MILFSDNLNYIQEVICVVSNLPSSKKLNLLEDASFIGKDINISTTKKISTSTEKKDIPFHRSSKINASPSGTLNALYAIPTKDKIFQTFRNVLSGLKVLLSCLKLLNVNDVIDCKVKSEKFVTVYS